MMQKFLKLLEGEDGAVTVDWVLLTAGIVGFGAIVILNFSGPLQHLDKESGDALTNMEVQDPVVAFELPSDSANLAVLNGAPPQKSGIVPFFDTISLY